MEFPVGLGGITLVVAALVWLFAFVPGYAQRSQISETSKFVKQQQRESDRAQPVTKDDQLRRLLNTQRWFALLFAVNLLASAGFLVATLQSGGWLAALVASSLAGVLSLAISRTAAKAASRLASALYKNRIQVRQKAQQSRPISREWTPNPIPQPLASLPKPEVIPAPIADVISIDKPRKALTGSEIDQILARRRAI